MSIKPTTTQVAFEELMNFIFRARGLDPTFFLPNFRELCEDYEQRMPSEEFLAELAEAKRELLEHVAIEKRLAVNGMISGQLIADHFCETQARIIRLREAELRCPNYLELN